MKRGQSAIEFLLIAVVLVVLAFYSFTTVIRETEINIAISAARQGCYTYSVLKSNPLKSVNYSLVGINVVIKPVFSRQLSDAELGEVRSIIIKNIFCSLDQNVEPSNCTRNYNAPMSTKFMYNYSVSR